MPNLSDLLGTFMRTVIRKFVYELPKKWTIPLTIITVIVSALFGKK